LYTSPPPPNVCNEEVRKGAEEKEGEEEKVKISTKFQIDVAFFVLRVVDGHPTTHQLTGRVWGVWRNFV
jgi:hypothetical protein